MILAVPPQPMVVVQITTMYLKRTIWTNAVNTANMAVASITGILNNLSMMNVVHYLNLDAASTMPMLLKNLKMMNVVLIQTLDVASTILILKDMLGMSVVM